RDFLKMSSAGLAGATLAASSFTSIGGAGLAVSPGGSRLRKAVKFGMVKEDLSILEKFKLLKKLGFDGVEMDSPSELDQKEVLRARDESGLPIPGVVDSVHWRKTLSDPDPNVRAQGLEGLKTALADAKAYGATTVLLVPAVVNKQVSYDEAYKRSQAEIRKALPLAEKNGVKVAIENVWNQFLLSPLEFAGYIDSFQSPWIGAHFDVGNVVTYGWPEHWIRILAHRILKLDIKEYSREKRDKEGPWAGFRVKLGDGDCDWPAVTKALADIGYEGWATAEVPGGGSERLREIANRMDRVLPT
ncbi:sugar phosphate isomerase/epimerase, partial [Acidobacteria bacterium AH-259-G07]|nr:sugar phosphate isomerase/epimerase [Acidobacteria bacterium AH-259-G07]